MLCTLLLLCGDVQVNPGPVGNSGELTGANGGVSPPCGSATATVAPNLGPVFDLNTSLLVYSDTNLDTGDGRHQHGKISGGSIGQLGEFVTANSQSLLAQVPNPPSCRWAQTISAHRFQSGYNVNPAIVKNRRFKLFKTVNHARVLWDSRAEPSGLVGGHVNISARPKNEQLQHLLYQSNLDA